MIIHIFTKPALDYTEQYLNLNQFSDIEIDSLAMKIILIYQNQLLNPLILDYTDKHDWFIYVANQIRKAANISVEE